MKKLQTTRDFIHHTWFYDALKNYVVTTKKTKSIHDFFLPEIFSLLITYY